MNVCIDTCAYSGMRRGDPRMVDAIQYADTVYVPATVLGELYAGFQLGQRARNNVDELERFLELPDVLIQDTDQEVAQRYGLVVRDLRDKGTPIPTNDIWIAASALATGARLLTLDAHFAAVPGLAVLGLE